MGSNQDKILEVLSGLIPEDTQDKVSTVITAAFNEAVADLEKQYEAKLEEAYKAVTQEREDDWKVAEQGYTQAYEVITDLRNRLDLQQQEFDHTLEEEYEKAYKMLVEERNKNQTIGDDLYQEYDQKFNQVKEWMVDRVDEFLAKQGNEYYEMARRQALSDPALAEHRVAFDRVLEVAADFLTDEDYMLKTSSKVDEMSRTIEQTKRQVQMLESKNTRLMTENTKMQDYIRQTKELIEEGVLNEQKERAEKARTVEGRGVAITEPERQVVVGEPAEGTAAKTLVEQNDDGPKTIAEQWEILAGLNKKS